MKKTASLLSCLLLAACVVDESDPTYGEYEAAIDDDPDDIPEELAPEAPTGFQLTNKSTSSVTMKWATPHNVTSTRVQRSVAGGPWTTVRSYGELPPGPVEPYTNAGLAQDTHACFRVAVYNQAGAAMSPVKCAVTDVSDGRPLARVRLEIRVADVDGAGTDDRVGVSLNDTAFGNFTGLNYSIDDVERNSTFKYDLDMTNIPELHDIANLTITKYGNDSLCLRSIRLLLNEVTAVSRTFGNTSTTCRMLNGSSTSTGRFNIPHAELRAMTSFMNWQPPLILPPVTISQEELEERLEGMMGDVIWNSPDVQWGEMQGTEYVEVSADEDDAQSIDVDYDLEGKVFGENPAVDVKLTLRADFVGQQLQIDSTSFDVQVDMAEWLAFIIDGIGAGICGVVSGESCENMIEEYFEEMAERNFEPISEVFDVDTTLCTSPPTVEVTSNGDLVLDCDFELP